MSVESNDVNGPTTTTYRSKLANEMDRSTLLPLGSSVVQQAHHVLALYDLVNAIDKVNRTNTLKENINKEPTVT